MSGVFISYRREDSEGYAGWIYDILCKYFGTERVFMDKSSIDPGAEFPETLKDHLLSCSAVLTVIGPRWLTIAGSSGRRRLDDPKDWVRQEIALALKRGLLIVPVLVGGSQLPEASQLPTELEPLSLRQAWDLPADAFAKRVRELATRLKRELSEAERQQYRKKTKEQLDGYRASEVPLRRYQYPLWVLLLCGMITASAFVSVSYIPDSFSAATALTKGNRALAEHQLDYAIENYKTALVHDKSSKEAKMGVAHALFLKGHNFDREALRYLSDIQYMDKYDRQGLCTRVRCV